MILGPWGIGLDAGGAIYFASKDGLIRTIPPADSAGQPGWTISAVAGKDWPKDLDGIGTDASFNWPMGLAMGSAGEIYVTTRYGNRVRQITPNASAGQTNWVVTTIAGGGEDPITAGANDGPGSTALFAMPVGVAVDDAGNLYVGDSLNATIRMLQRPNPSAGQTEWMVSTIAGQAQVRGIADGNGAVARFNCPSGVALDGAGNLYVADAYNHTIRMICPGASLAAADWTVSTIAGQPAIPGSADGTGREAQFNTPTGVAVDSGGNIYVADSANNTIRKITSKVVNGQTNWVVSTIGGLTQKSGRVDGSGVAARFTTPSSLTVDSRGVLYVSDNGNNAIRMGLPPAPLIMSNPMIINGQVQISFPIATGSGTSYKLLNSESAVGPWTANSSAVLTTNTAAGTCTLTAPLSGSAAQFYRVQR